MNTKEVTRVQTGVRLESRLLKVLKALATELDLSLGDLIEGIVLHAFDGKTPFSAATLRKVKALKGVYGLDLTAEDSHHLREADGNG
jgi:predicted DNA-binding ribbon-helix-helix protein